MPPSLHPGARFAALDVFRGLMIAGMVLVNAADLGGHAYPWLQHAGWDGCNFADTVFPGFLFIMGVAMGVSMQGPVRGSVPPQPLRRLYVRILRRTVVLFSLGLLLNGFFATGLEDLRIMGVLQRLALCYLLGAAILLHLPARAQLLIALGILVCYSAALRWVALPLQPSADYASSLANNLPAYIDRLVFGPSHLLRDAPYLGRLDPEGLLGTLPALANVLFGTLAGRYLARAPIARRTTLQLCAAGAAAWLAGFALSYVEPINKALWSSAFALVTSGVAACGLALCYELVDVRGHATATRWFEVLGRNAITAYLLSSVIDALMVRVHGRLAGQPEPLYELWLHASGLPRPDAAVVFALLQVLVVLACAQLMHARGWYLKV
jgi:predicted acyltransferase